MTFDEILERCPKCGGPNVTQFSAHPPSYAVVARNRCPEGHYELVGELEDCTITEAVARRDKRS